MKIELEVPASWRDVIARTAADRLPAPTDEQLWLEALWKGLGKPEVSDVDGGLIERMTKALPESSRKTFTALVRDYEVSPEKQGALAGKFLDVDGAVLAVGDTVRLLKKGMVLGALAQVVGLGRKYVRVRRIGKNYIDSASARHLRKVDPEAQVASGGLRRETQWLDAHGRPLKVGDRVRRVRTGRKGVVVRFARLKLRVKYDDAKVTTEVYPGLVVKEEGALNVGDFVLTPGGARAKIAALIGSTANVRYKNGATRRMSVARLRRAP